MSTFRATAKPLDTHKDMMDKMLHQRRKTALLALLSSVVLVFYLAPQRLAHVALDKHAHTRRWCFISKMAIKQKQKVKSGKRSHFIWYIFIYCCSNKSRDSFAGNYYAPLFIYVQNMYNVNVFYYYVIRTRL